MRLDAASNNSVDEISGRWSRQVRYAPQMGNYKIYIIDEVHMLRLGFQRLFEDPLRSPLLRGFHSGDYGKSTRSSPPSFPVVRSSTSTASPWTISPVI